MHEQSKAIQLGDILVVDDTLINRRLLSRQLEARGYRTRSVSSGPEALNAVGEVHPALILLDIKMPGMDGYEVCERLKQDESTAYIPIIFISAMEETQDKIKAFTAGGVDYITKPFQFEEVVARVQTHLALRGLQEKLQQTNQQLEKNIRDLDMLLDVAESLNQTVSLSEATQDGLESTLEQLGVQQGWLILSDDTGGQVVAVHNLSPDLIGMRVPAPECHDCDCGRLLLTGVQGTLVAISECTILYTALGQSGAQYGQMSIPLHLGDRVLGTLTLIIPPDFVLSMSEKRLFKTVGDLYSAAIERARLFDNTKQMAILDPLTGVFNRRHFFQLGEQEIQRALRLHYDLAIVMMDIDHFKLVNDNHGHAAGDRVLQEVADICRAGMRQSDVVARYGGEEFVILLPGAGTEGAEEVAERLRQKIEEASIDTAASKVSVTASFGVSNLDSEEEMSLEALIDKADQALYIAKESGRNQVAVWGCK